MTVAITLRSGHVLLVDEQDEELARAYSWHASHSRQTWYARTSSARKTVYLHRLLLGATRGQIVDHCNGNGLDNRRDNLRFVTHTQNCQNRRRKRTSVRVSYKGVSVSESRFRAEIVVDGQRIRLGTFDTELEAAQTYDAAARLYFGEFARCNFEQA